MASVNGHHWLDAASDYAIDAAQRSVLFWDILRQRGNLYLDHLKKGQPPVLAFDYETVVDGRTFERPANYALVRIVDRRARQTPDRGATESTPAPGETDHGDADQDRRHGDVIRRSAPEDSSRPIVIIDPRAGHGPGIGGSKQDSQIGMALNAGHPVYFMVFFTDPMPGQTLADVRNAQIRFIEAVRERHPSSPKPAVIGNCQGGWAAALVGAERPDLVGPMVFNGSPISYWGGVEGVSPMRYLGGLLGGVWINGLLSDLGNGRFDGANLVANFENLNPANTLWSKPYNVYANVDTEARRFLDFERWWGGFFLMNREEIHTIVDGLFVGNKLERGEFELEAGRKVDLKQNSNPVVVFASFGDNITPPQQAFNWIIKTYGTVEEIKRRGQVIVGIGHARIGHLGIFVSAKVARKEHKEIIASFDILDRLPPGLYEMRIQEGPEEPGEYRITYTERQMADILALDDGQEDERAFFPARTISRLNDTAYQLWVSPWIRLLVNESAAETLRQLHPLRVQRYLISDLNPWMAPVRLLSERVGHPGVRRPVASDNPFLHLEKTVSGTMVAGMNLLRDMRDHLCEQAFKAVYENPWMRLLQPAGRLEEAKTAEAELEDLRRQDANHWREQMAEGGFAEAVVRMLLALGLSDGEIRSHRYEEIAGLMDQDRRLRTLDTATIENIYRTQARILQTDTDQAIETLGRLLPSPTQRTDALAFVASVVTSAGRPARPEESSVLGRIREVLAGNGAPRER